MIKHFLYGVLLALFLFRKRYIKLKSFWWRGRWN